MEAHSPVSPLSYSNFKTIRPAYTEGTKKSERPERYPERDGEKHIVSKADNDGAGIQMTELKTPSSPEKVFYNRKLPETDPCYPRPSLGRSTSSPSTFSHKKTDSITENLIARRSTKAAKWRIHWRAPLTIISSFIIGLILAIGQHVLYSSLNHKSAENEGQKTREVLYGRALAYFSKVAFGGCVTMVYRQRLWTTFRNEALSVWSIDQLFLGTEDPTLFFNWETIRKALLPTIIALVIWLIPLATIIFSPGALSFGEFLEVTNYTIGTVPTLDFNAESTANWRNPVEMPDKSLRKSLMFYNTTDREGKKEGWFDYYDQPSADLTRLSVLNAWSLGNQSLMRPDARQISCGSNYNCTYTTRFRAPQYKCEKIASGPQDDHKLLELGAPFNTSALVPYGKHVYLANVDEGNYERPQAPDLSNDGGVPQGTIPEDLGTFKIEPKLWLGYSTNSTESWPANSPFAANWTHRLDAHIIRCVHYEAKYTVDWNYTEPFYRTTVRYEFMQPVLDTNFTRLKNGKPDYDTLSPSSNFVSPRLDVAKYKKIAAYHALGQSVRDFLRGKIELEPEFPGPSYPRVFSKITQTRLVSKTNSTPFDNFSEHIQNFYADTVLSLFSAPELLVMAEQMTVVNRTRFQATFVYDPWKLWACYGPVILTVFLILILYAYTIWQDGTTWSVGFSRILVTTRNQTLDEISRGACLGNDPFPSELLRTKLKFGVLNDSSDVDILGLDGITEIGHCSFGVPSELSPIVNGRAYAGLRRRGVGQEKQKVD